MTNYRQPGESVTLTAPTGGVVSGTAYLIGSLVVVAAIDAAQTLPFTGMTVGVFELAKATGQTWTEGAKLYLDNTAHNLTTTAGGNTLAGVAVADAASGDTTGLVRLDGVAR